LLDPRLLAAFVEIVDTGSFTAAADRLHLTQSTVSQQLARLEATVGQQLVHRNTRPVQATVPGERLAGYARRILALEREAQTMLGDPAGTQSIRIGLPEDLVTDQMAAVFRACSLGHRSVRLDITTGLSRNLTERYRGGELDIVIVKESAASADCHASFPEALAWFESADDRRPWSDPIALVTFPPGGLYREAMFEQIERERRKWYVAFSGSSFQSVLVGVETGLGLSVLPIKAVAGRRVREYAPLGSVPPMVVALYAWDQTGPAAELVRQMTAVLARRLNIPDQP